ncbi:MAG: DUF4465 domain-containing protein [Muribaculaceae bacterium]|nr:DUF4465 domain-containing protein [Muribaculaceae bacterium]
MKIKNILSVLAIASFASATLTSCGDEKFDLDMYYLRMNKFTDFNSEGYWSECYEPAAAAGFDIDGVHFSHKVNITEWDGVKYYSWNGFCPSTVFDMTDYSAEGSWTEHQWGAMASSQWVATHKAFVLGDWDVRENARPDTFDPTSACTISLVDGKAFIPLTMHVSNSVYAYFSMVNGSAFSRPFGKDDYLRLIVTGFLDGQKTGVIEVNLAADNVYLTNFEEVDLAPTGALVDHLVFTVEGSDSGQWGLNTPAYFAIGAFTYALDK